MRRGAKELVEFVLGGEDGEGFVSDEVREDYLQVGEESEKRVCLDAKDRRTVTPPCVRRG